MPDLMSGAAVPHDDASKYEYEYYLAQGSRKARRKYCQISRVDHPDNSQAEVLAKLHAQHCLALPCVLMSV